MTAFARQADAEGKFFVVAPGATEPSGLWSAINSGVFLIKNDARGADFLARTMTTDSAVVVDWWDEKRYGICTGGMDQDIMTWLLETQGFGEQFGLGHELVPEDLLDRFHVTVRSPMGRGERAARESIAQAMIRTKPHLQRIRPLIQPAITKLKKRLA